MAYDIPTSEAIEREYRTKNKLVDLSSTQLGIPNIVDFQAMIQMNKYTHFQRRVQRLRRQNYPMDTQGQNVTRKSPSKGLNASSATVNGYMASSHSRSLTSGVTGTSAKTVSKGKKAKRVKVAHSQGTVFHSVCVFLNTLY